MQMAVWRNTVRMGHWLARTKRSGEVQPHAQGKSLQYLLDALPERDVVQILENIPIPLRHKLVRAIVSIESKSMSDPAEASFKAVDSNQDGILSKQ